jgi:hypothetical protein
VGEGRFSISRSLRSLLKFAPEKSAGLWHFDDGCLAVEKRITYASVSNAFSCTFPALLHKPLKINGSAYGNRTRLLVEVNIVDYQELADMHACIFRWAAG